LWVDESKVSDFVGVSFMQKAMVPEKNGRFYQMVHVLKSNM
jgi:hypothetical protein